MSSIDIRNIDITELSTDIIVNAANTGLQAGGGVCGAIFRAAGYADLQNACDQIGHCDTGFAVITPGFHLQAKYVVHAVGPIWQGGTQNEPQIHDDNCYCKYYDVVYILFHTGIRISEFCGLTIRDVDLKNKILNIDHQLQRMGDMKLVIEKTKTNAGTRKLPLGDDVVECFQRILKARKAPDVEKIIDGYSGFLFLDDEGLPLVAMHWEHRFNNMVHRYNEIFREQLPNITPHVCRHTYCSIQAKAGMYPKTLQYLMGHSDIGVTMNTYTHLGLEDAVEEMSRMQEVEAARKEQEKLNGHTDEVRISKRQFRAG